MKKYYVKMNFHCSCHAKAVVLLMSVVLVFILLSCGGTGSAKPIIPEEIEIGVSDGIISGTVDVDGKTGQVSMSGMSVGDMFRLNLSDGSSEIVSFNARFSSSDPSVAIVSADGCVEIVGYGTAVITIDVGGREITCVIESWIPISEIICDKILELELGAAITVKLPYSLVPAEGTDGRLLFSGYDSRIIDVSSSGVVTAKAVGETSVKVSAASHSSNANALCTVRVVESAHEHVYDSDYKCTICGYQHQHSYASTWSSDDNNHWRVAVCGHNVKSDEGEHAYGSDVWCSICGHCKYKLSGVFSVGEKSRIRFAMGNLFWDGKKFDIEASQHDYRTWYSKDEKNSVIGGVKCKTPLYADSKNGYNGNNSTTGLFYYVWLSGLAGTYAGIYDDSGANAYRRWFPLANGHAIKGFDVLTRDEWNYLLYDRAEASSKCILTSSGLVLLPDEWEIPDGCSFETKGDFTSIVGWDKMEEAGAVFLYPLGRRWNAQHNNEVLVSEAGRFGHYWSSSCNEENSYFYVRCAYALHIDIYRREYRISSAEGDSGGAVRLVVRVQD